MSTLITATGHLRDFLSNSRFGQVGAVLTDLDGTAVHEHEGRVVIPKTVEFGLKEVRDLGRPIIINSLRFPLSVIRSFGQEWYAIANAPIPTVSLNGSLTGYVTQSASGELAFEEIDAVPLEQSDIEEVLDGVRGLIDGGVTDLLVFYYPRDWTVGEIIWTPDAGRVPVVRDKYGSASKVYSAPVEALLDHLLAEEICMIFLLIDAPEDRLMAYQHGKRANFFTANGVDKLHGAQRIADRLGVDLAHSVGAGDTEMDSFLKGVGLAVLVGANDLSFRGVRGTIKLDTAPEFGALLFRLAELQREVAR